MSLDAYAMPGVSTNIEAELSRRLSKTLDHFGGRVMIESGYRSRAQQQKLYDDWVRSGYKVPPSVAKPGTSKHERDPAEAADLDRNDPALTWGEVHYTAHGYGLRFPIPNEDWHCEVDPSWVEPPTPPEVDMTKQEFAEAIGAQIPTEGPFAGLVCVELADGPTTGSLYPLASAISYIHKEQKYPST